MGEIKEKLYDKLSDVRNIIAEHPKITDCLIVGCLGVGFGELTYELFGDPAITTLGIAGGALGSLTIGLPLLYKHVLLPPLP